MLTFSSPTKVSLFYFFPTVWPIVQSFLEVGGGGELGGGVGKEARFLEQKFVNCISKKSLMKTDCIGHRLTFFLFFEQRVHLIYFSANFVVLNYHSLSSE